MPGSRKTPVNTPPLSRSSSVSRDLKGKASNVNPDPQTNGNPKDSDTDPSKSSSSDTATVGRSQPSRRRPSKPGKQKQKRKSGHFFDLLYYCLFIFLTLYVVSVCPTDRGQDHQICRFARGYRQNVLDPLVIRPVTTILSHPSVSPIVNRVKPHLRRLIKATRLLIRNGQAEVNFRVSSQWNKRVVPQWRRHVAPHIRNFDKATRSYRAQITKQYKGRIAPSLRTVRRHLQRYSRNAQENVMVLASKAQDLYKMALPHVRTTLRHLEPYVVRILLEIRTQRRLFVDPHVAKIWDKVKELSSGKPKEQPTSSVIRAPTSSLAASSFLRSPSIKETAQPTLEFSTPSHTAVVEQTPLTDEIASPSTASASDTPPPSEQAIPVADETAPPTDEWNDTSVSASDEVPSVSSDRSTQTDSVESDIVVETLSSVSSLLSETLHDIPTASPAIASLTEELHSSAVSAAASTSAQNAESIHDGLSLDDFFADLGLDEFAEKPSQTAVTVTLPDVTEVAVDPAEAERLRVEETARKRAAINSRHTKWEAELEELIENKMAELRKALVTMRKAAAVELKESTAIRGLVEALDREGEKYLRGAETYVQNLQKEAKTDDNRLWSWSRVVNRVEEKFTEQTKKLEAMVNDWSRDHIQREHEEVRVAQATVKDTAERAQSDLGLDYAWLDDVTYHDWQRYHDLIRRSERFAEQSLAIQNGTHPSPPINPVFAALEDLSSELEDLILGFHTRLRRIKRTASRQFTNAGQDGTNVEDDEGASEPEFSILPITESKPSADVNVEGVPPPVILGRDKEEILQAMGRMEEQEAKAVKSGEVSAENAPVPDPVNPKVADHIEL